MSTKSLLNAHTGAVLFVHWTADCEAVPDDAAAAYVDSVLARFRQDGYPEGFSCGQEVVVNELRLRVQRGELAPEQLVFVHEGRHLPVNRAGRLPAWPRGFCDVASRQLSALVRGASAQSKD